MGEKITTLSSGKSEGMDLQIELNHPVTEGACRQVHIQSRRFRMEMDEKNYIKYALAVLAAEKNFRGLKGLS